LDRVLNLLHRFDLSQAGGSFWMPPQSSTAAPGVDKLFYFIFWIAFFFFLLIVGLMVHFIVRYRKQPGRAPEKPPTHNTKLELTWTFIPLAIVFVIFYFGFHGFVDIATPPGNSYDIQVHAQRWKWTFTYPNGYVDENLHVPVDRPVRLTMTSDDVIHALFVPDFRIKRDVVPGRYNITWFRATTPGTHDLFCAEYCGTGHSLMYAQVIVHPPGEFEKWLETSGDAIGKLPPAEAGQRLYKTRGCAQCHSIDGKAGIGPTFKGVFGHPVPLKDGKTVVADENYVRESILNPQAQVVAGFDPVMPTYQGRLKDNEITMIIAYLKTLSQ
jgi:cytochrome c oxidase subunit II